MTAAAAALRDFPRAIGAFVAIASVLNAAALAQTPEMRPPPTLNPVRTIDKANLKAFLERPLFDPSRSLPPPIREAPPMTFEAPRTIALAPPPPLHLIGIIEGKNSSVALVRRDGDHKTMILADGDKIGNWTVTVLPTLGIKLNDGSRDISYGLFPPGLDKGAEIVKTLPVR